MKLAVSERSDLKKSTTGVIRREGQIPAVLYSQGKIGVTLTVDGIGFKSVLRGIEKGTLPTTIFDLETPDGKKRRAIVKDIQYHVTTYDILHLDFEELHEGVKVRLKVPIQCTGVVDCSGVKQGGMLRQIIRHIEVECFPKDIPTHFDMDVRDLNLMHSRRLKDLKLPSTVRPLSRLGEVAVVVSKGAKG